jgi:phosphoribosylglycinamide formyltransferase
LKAGKTTHTGIMVHYVVLTVDRGEPIMVQKIKWNGEDLPQLEEKIHSYEHELIVKATAKVARIILEERAK